MRTSLLMGERFESFQLTIVEKIALEVKARVMMLSNKHGFEVGWLNKNIF